MGFSSTHFAVVYFRIVMAKKGGTSIVHFLSTVYL